MEVFLVYLWLKLDSFRGILIFTGLCLALIPLVIYAICQIECLSDDDEEKLIKIYRPKVKKLTIIGVIFLLFVTLTPSSKEIAILVGTSYAVDLAKSPEGAKVVSLIRKKVNEYLDEALAEGKKEVVE